MLTKPRARLPGWGAALTRGALVGASVLAALLVSTGAPAWAGSSPSTPAAPGLSPVRPGPNGYFEYTLSSGASKSGAIVVHDLTTSPASYLVYAVGATTSPVGGVAYGQPQANPQGTASWVKLSTGSVRLSAKGAVAVQFTVTVPADTAPGDYVAALAAQTPKPKAVAAASSNKTGVSLVTTTRVIVAVVVEVPGPAAPAAHFGPPSIGLQQHVRQVITIPIYDTGAVLMKPYLAGDLRRCSGGPPVLSLAQQLDTFVPRTSIDYPWYLRNQVLSAGCYRVAVSLDLGAGGTRLASYTGTLQVGVAATKVRRPPVQRPLVPQQGLPSWLLPAAAGAALLLLIAVLLLLRGRSQRRRLLERLEAKASQP